MDPLITVEVEEKVAETKMKLFRGFMVHRGTTWSELADELFVTQVGFSNHEKAP